ncbi:MAG: hypothetical protein P8183_24475, partial [Anaerolineae bacterium]
MKQKIGAILAAFSAALLLLSWLWSSNAAFAVQTDIVTVCASGCDYTTISDAVYLAPEGSIVDVQAGTYNENVVITQSLTVQGQGSTTIVDGQENGSVIEITPGSAVTIKQMVLQNGLSVSGGGGVYNDGTLTLTNLLIQNNVADCADGGGVLNLSQLTLQDVIFTNNTAPFGAGMSNDKNGIAAASHITATQNQT